MRKKLLVVIGIVCAVGAIVAAFSTEQHFQIAREGFEHASFCAINNTINCDLVNASSFSELLGVPVAWWGTLYFLLLACMCFIAAYSKKEQRATASIASFMALAGVPFCLYLAYAAYFIVGAVCIECLTMYAVTFIAAVGLFFALRIPLTRAPAYIIDYARAACGGDNRLGFAHRAWTHVIVVALVFGIGWVVIKNIQLGARPLNGSTLTVQEQVRAHYQQAASTITTDPSWPVWGNPKAKISIVEFSEFQCPFCKLASFMIKPFLQEFRNDVAYYFVNYPLDMSCNSMLKEPMHPYSCYLSRAALCANERGSFWSYHDKLFRNQDNLSPALALDLAANDFGWSRDEFQRCIDAPATESKLAAQIAAGQDLGLMGTPALFLNGRKVMNWRDRKVLQALVREEIRRSNNK